MKYEPFYREEKVKVKSYSDIIHIAARIDGNNLILPDGSVFRKEDSVYCGREGNIDFKFSDGDKTMYYVRNLGDEKSGLIKFSSYVLDNLNPDQATATWEICEDGWYPYCSNCNEEPDYTPGGIPEYCPNCHCKMTNYKDFRKS